MKVYTVDIKGAQTILGYTELFGEEKPDLAEEIKKLNVHKAISIISELIQVRDATCNPIHVGGMEINLPFDIGLKREFGGMKPSSAKEMFDMDNLHKDKHIVSLQMVLILLKKILIYALFTRADCKDVPAQWYRYSSNHIIKYSISVDFERRMVIVIDGATKKFTEDELVVFSYILDNPHATYETMVNALGISRKTVAERIKGLKGNSKIQRVGSDARGYWKVNQ